MHILAVANIFYDLTVPREFSSNTELKTAEIDLKICPPSKRETRHFRPEICVLWASSGSWDWTMRASVRVTV